MSTKALISFVPTRDMTITFTPEDLPADNPFEPFEGGDLDGLQNVLNQRRPVHFKAGNAYTIYSHWDGYPEGVGAALYESFTTEEHIANPSPQVIVVWSWGMLSRTSRVVKSSILLMRVLIIPHGWGRHGADTCTFGPPSAGGRLPVFPLLIKASELFSRLIILVAFLRELRMGAARRN